MVIWMSLYELFDEKNMHKSGHALCWFYVAYFLALTYGLVAGEEGEPGAAEVGSGNQGLGLEHDGARQDQSAMTCRKSEWVWMSNVRNDIKLALRNLSYISKSDCCDYSNKTKGQVVSMILLELESILWYDTNVNIWWWVSTSSMSTRRAPAVRRNWGF